MIFKDFLALQIYNKRWNELSSKERGHLILNHQNQIAHFQLKGKKMEDRDLLVEIRTDVAWIKGAIQADREGFQDHLKTHTRFYLLIGGAFLSSFIAIVLTVFT